MDLAAGRLLVVLRLLGVWGSAMPALLFVVLLRSPPDPRALVSASPA